MRYYSGDCSSTTCGCSYQTENCTASSGWYDTSEYRFVRCSDDSCKECQQKKQEYRDYGCTPGECVFDITDERWIDTGFRRAIKCPTGTFCFEGECKVPSCEGSIDINTSTIQVCPKQYFSASVGNLTYCKNKRVDFRLDSCDGTLLTRCTLNTLSECKKNLMIIPLSTPTIFACIDKNGDGDFKDAGEQDSITVNVNCNNCKFTTCPSSVGCFKCAKCGGDPSKRFTNEYGVSVCLNPGQTCEYMCIPGSCAASVERCYSLYPLQYSGFNLDALLNGDITYSP